MKYFLTIVFLFSFLSHSVHSEVNNKKLLKSVFDGCIGTNKTIDPKQFLYCGCYVTKLGEKYDNEEFITMLLGIGVLPKKDQYKEMLKEDKVIQSLSDCIHFME